MEGALRNHTHARAKATLAGSRVDTWVLIPQRQIDSRAVNHGFFFFLFFKHCLPPHDYGVLRELFIRRSCQSRRAALSSSTSSLSSSHRSCAITNNSRCVLFHFQTNHDVQIIPIEHALYSSPHISTSISPIARCDPFIHC